MSEDNKEYEVLAYLVNDPEPIRSVVKAPNLQEALRKSVKLVPARAGYAYIAINDLTHSHA